MHRTIKRAIFFTALATLIGVPLFMGVVTHQKEKAQSTAIYELVQPRMKSQFVTGVWFDDFGRPIAGVDLTTGYEVFFSGTFRLRGQQ